MAVQWFSYLDVLLLVVVDGLPIYLVIAKAVATALLYPIKDIGDAIVYVLVGVVILGCKEFVNHHIELTEEEKAQARQEAIRQYQQEQMNKMRNRDTAKRTSQRTETEVHQPSLFDTL